MGYNKTIKYVVHPGYVRSISDSDIHYISAPQLMLLYDVSSEECIIVSHKRPENTKGYKDINKLIHLYPRNDGKYNLLKNANK